MPKLTKEIKDYFSGLAKLSSESRRKKLGEKKYQNWLKGISALGVMKRLKNAKNKTLNSSKKV